MAFLLKRPWTAFKRSLHLRSNGFLPLPDPDPENVRKDAKTHLDFIREAPQKISEPNRSALIRINELADDHQIDIFIVASPLFQGLYSNTEFRDYFDAMHERVKNIIASYRHVHFIMNPPVTYPAEEMASVDHLPEKESTDFTSLLVDKIRKVLDHDATLF